MDQSITHRLNWKLRRIAGNLRQLDVSRKTGISITRYSEIERGRRPVTELEARVLEMVLPSLETPFEEAKERDAYRASRAAAWVLG